MRITNRLSMATAPSNENFDLVTLIQKKYDTLSRSQKKLAVLAFEYPSLVCTCTTLELAAKAGVSNATVVRFASALGFSGYAELQKFARQEHFSNRYIKEPPFSGEPSGMLEHIRERQTRQLAQSFSHITQEDFDRVVETIVYARRIYVTGVRSVFAPAHFLSRMLDIFFRNATFLPLLGESAYEELYKAGREDLFFCITVNRYSRNSYILTELASERNIPIAVVTDNPLAPAARLADMILKVDSRSTTIASSVLGLTAVMEAIISALTVRPGINETIRSNLKESENWVPARIFINAHGLQ